MISCGKKISMHELSVTQEIVKTVEQAVDNAGRGLRVKSIRIILGRLTGVIPEYIRFYYEMLTEDKPGLAGAEVNIEIQPIVMRCGACGNEYESPDGVNECPECGDAKGNLISGRELLIDSIEVEEIGVSEQ